MGVVKWIRVQWDRAAGAGLVVAGAVALLIGWVGVSGAVYPAEQLPFLISGGLGGLFLLGAGATLWLSADLRDEWRHLDAMEERIEQRVAALVEARLQDVASANGRPRARREGADR